MTNRLGTTLAIAAVCASMISRADAAGETVGIPTTTAGIKRLARMPLDEIRRHVFETITTRPDADASIAAVTAALWTEAAVGTDDSVDRLARTVALVDDRAAVLVRLCSGPTEPWLVPDQPWLDDAELPPFLRSNLRLYFGRWLAQRKMYDRALGALAGLEPADVVDPASLLFYQAASYHHQLRKKPGLRAIDRLLDDVADCPPRFQVVAGLMREDLKKLEDESLDHIARRMDDIRRRLDFGNGGNRTRRIEDGVVESLDKIIEDLEKQRQQQQGGGGGGGGQSGTPMQDSQIAKQKGPGNVDPKNIGSKSDWGDLPAETREQIKQQIGRDLPAHYYDLIQQYFNGRRSGSIGGTSGK